MPKRKSGKKSAKAGADADDTKPENLHESEACQDPEAEGEIQSEEPEPRADERSLEERLAEAQQQAQEAQDRYLYAVAELQNYKRRTQRDLADRLQYANEQILGDLLPVVDHLRLALEAAAESTDTETLRRGVEMTLAQLEGVMARYGVAPIQTVGETFDPSVHEAVERVAADAPEGTVVEEVTRGYRLHDRTLRAARVKVAVARADEEREEGEPEAKEK